MNANRLYLARLYDIHCIKRLILYKKCFTGYDGRFCTEDFDGCTSVLCFEDVTCVDVPAPGVGAMCGPCPAGYFGNGQKCDGKQNIMLDCAA